MSTGWIGVVVAWVWVGVAVALAPSAGRLLRRNRRRMEDLEAGAVAERHRAAQAAPGRCYAHIRWIDGLSVWETACAVCGAYEAHATLGQAFEWSEAHDGVSRETLRARAEV